MCFTLKEVYDRIREKIAMGERPQPDLVEMVAVLERVLAYAHTGNAKVLSRGLMGPMWLVTSLIEHGLPTLAPGIYLAANSPLPIQLPLSGWPEVNNKPGSASQRALVLTYGASLYGVTQAQLPI